LHPLILTVISSILNSATTTYIYTLSLHDALPILISSGTHKGKIRPTFFRMFRVSISTPLEVWASIIPAISSVKIGMNRMAVVNRSEEHTSELQSRENLVCRLLLEKEKKNIAITYE